MRRRPAAYTLLEVTVVASILSMLMLVTATTMLAMYSGSRRLRESTYLQSSSANLALQLRRDVHAARDVSVRNGAKGEVIGLIVSRGGDLQVEYTAEDAGVRRVVRRGDQRIHRELFRLDAKRHRIAWRVVDGPPRHVVVDVRYVGSPANSEQTNSDKTNSAQLGPDSFSGLRIVATVGLTPGELSAESGTPVAGAEGGQE